MLRVRGSLQAKRACAAGSGKTALENEGPRLVLDRVFDQCVVSVVSWTEEASRLA